jgi:phage-related protein
MTDRIITIKFTGNVKDLVAAAAAADISLSKVDKSASKASSNGLKDFTKGLKDLGQSVSDLAPKARIIGLVTEGISLLNKAGPGLLQMVGIVGLVPGAIAVAASSMLVLKLGAAGLQAAFKGVGDSAKKSVSDTFQKDMAPAAKNVNAVLKNLTPTLDLNAKAMSGVAVRITGMLRSASGLSALHTIFMATEMAVTNVGNAVGSLLDAFLAVAKVSAPIFARLTGGITGWAAKFDSKIQAMANDGRLQAWIENGIAKFESFAHTAVTDFKKIAEALKGFTSLRVDIFQQFGPILLKVLTAVGNFVQAHPTLGTWIVGIALALQVLGPAIKGVAAALTLLDANPIGLIIIGIAALVAGFIYLWNHSAAFRVFWINLWKEIQAIVKTIVAWFTSSVVPFFKGIWDKLKILASTFAEFWRAFWNSDLGKVVKTVLATLVTVIKLAWSVIVLVFKAAFDVLKGVVKGAWDLIKGIFEGAFNIIRGILDVFIGLFTGNWGKAWQGVKEIATGVWDILKGGFNALKDVFVGIGHAIGDICSGIGNVFKGMVNIVVGALNGMIGLVNIAINGINTLTSGISKAWSWTGVIPSIPAIPHIPKIPEWRADGGTAQAGRPYIVGERGPELFWPGQTGRVTNADQSGGLGSGVTIHGDIVLPVDLGNGVKQVIRIHNRDLKAKVRAGSGMNR